MVVLLPVTALVLVVVLVLIVFLVLVVFVSVVVFSFVASSFLVVLLHWLLLDVIVPLEGFSVLFRERVVPALELF